jgi:isocitrate dehydrogenase (NAD+)
MIQLTRTLFNKACFGTRNYQKVVMFPGNGIGPEISRSVEDIFMALSVPVEFEHHEIHTRGQTEHGDLISNESI